MSLNSRREKHRNVRRQLRFESMESRQLLAADMFQHNLDMPDDVNGDQFVSPMDALAVINQLNSLSQNSSPFGGSLLSGASAAMYLDVNDDGIVSPMDALSVINTLNSSTTKSAPPATTPIATTPIATTPDASAPVTTPPTSTPVTTSPSGTPQPTPTTTPTSGTTPPTSSIPTGTTSASADLDDDEALGTTQHAEIISLRLVAKLQGTGAQTASVVFESGSENGVAQIELEVRVRNSTPSTTLDVVLNSVNVGSVTTDASGNGVLLLAAAPSTTSELPLPANFPDVSTATTVQIGTTMSGTMSVPTSTNPYVSHEGDSNHEGDSEFDHQRKPGSGSQDHGETQFTSLLAGTGAQLGYVQFESESHRGTLRNELGISVNSLTPNAALDVIIDGITVGQILTDADGHGDLDLSSLPVSARELALPANFPAIATGSTIQIGTELSGTFAARPIYPTLPTTPAAVTLQPQRLDSIGHDNSHHRSRHR